AYVIFHDATLAEMVEREPQNLNQLALISGVGQRKLEAYGESVVEVIRINSRVVGNSSTVVQTIALFCQGWSPLAIAHKRDLTLTTVYKHLAQAISEGELVLADIFEFEPKELNAIEFAFEHSEEGRLKPVYDAFDGKYDYGLLECVKAAMKSS